MASINGVVVSNIRKPGYPIKGKVILSVSVEDKINSDDPYFLFLLFFFNLIKFLL